MNLSLPKFAIPVLAAGLAVINSGYAADSSWTGLAADGLYGTAGNWSAGVPTPGNTAFFNSAGNGFTTVGLGGNSYSVSVLSFSNAASAAYTIGSTVGDGTFTFQAGGTPIAMTAAVVNDQTINPNLTLGTTTNQTFSNLSTTNNLIVNGTVSGSASTQTLTLTGNGGVGGHGGVLSGVISNGAAANMGVILGGGGVWRFNAANTFGGRSVTIGGTAYNVGLQINAAATAQIGNNSALGSDTIYVTNVSGTIEAVGGARTINNGILTNNTNFTVGGSNALTVNGPIRFIGSNTATINNTALTTFAGNFYLRNNTTAGPSNAVISGTGNLLVSGSIRNNEGLPGQIGTGNLLINNTGTVTLSGTNTYTGTTTINTTGTVVANTSSAFGGTTAGALTLTAGTLNIGAGTGVTLNASSFTWNSGSTIKFDLGTDLLAITGALNKAGTGTYTFNFNGTGTFGQTYTLFTFGSNAGAFTNGVFSATNVPYGGTFAITGTSLTFTVIPEPQEYAMGVMGVLGALIFFHNRRRRLTA